MVIDLEKGWEAGVGRPGWKADFTSIRLSGRCGPQGGHNRLWVRWSHRRLDGVGGFDTFLNSIPASVRMQELHAPVVW